MHDVLSKKGVGSNEPFSAEKQYEVQTTANDFLTGKIEDIEFLGSVRMVKEYLTQMKNSFAKLRQESANLLESHASNRSDKAASATDKLRAQKSMAGGGIGVEENTG